MSGRAWAVCRKELRDAMRDGRTIIAVFVVPFILYPGLMLFMGWTNPRTRRGRRLQVSVGVVGEAQLPGLTPALKALEGVTTVPLDRVPPSLEARAWMRCSPFRPASRKRFRGETR